MVEIWDPGPNIRIYRHTLWANHRLRFWTRFRLSWPSSLWVRILQPKRTDVLLVCALCSYVIVVDVRGGHFVGVARAPTRRSLRTHEHRCPLWVLGSDVIDCGADWRAVSNSAYHESVIGRKWLSKSVVGACICCGCMCYSQDNTTDPHLIALKVTFDTSPFAVNYWLIVLINNNISRICQLIRINSLEVDSFSCNSIE